MKPDENTQHLHGWTRRGTGTPKLEKCSLVIATYRRPGEMNALLKCLAGLEDPPAEIVVVDGSPGSETCDGIISWARETELPFDLHYVASPAGLTRQRNVGIDASTGEYVFFLDDDCIPQEGYFRQIFTVLAEERNSNVGGVCGSIMNEMNRPLSLRWKIRFFFHIVPRGEPGRYYPTATSVPRGLSAPFNGTRHVDILPGCSMSFRRKVFERERFSRFFYGYSQGEDLEMSLRVGRTWELLWCGDAHVIHNHVPGARPASFAKGRMEVRNRFFIRQRHTVGLSLLDRLRFWLDIAYVGSYDLVSLIVRPGQWWYLSHALGVGCASLECLFSPPRYTEPPARREYVVSFKEVSVV